MKNGIPKLTIYKYTSDSNVIGTMQLNNLTEQDTNISKEIDKLKSNGNKDNKEDNSGSNRRYFIICSIHLPTIYK